MWFHQLQNGSTRFRRFTDTRCTIRMVRKTTEMSEKHVQIIRNRNRYAVEVKMSTFQKYTHTHTPKRDLHAS